MCVSINSVYTHTRPNIFLCTYMSVTVVVWYIGFMAYQSLMGYFILKAVIFKILQAIILFQVNDGNNHL